MFSGRPCSRGWRPSPSAADGPRVFLIVWIVRKLAVIALLLAVPAVAGELIARKLVGDTVRSAVVARFGGSPSVSFGTAPLLWQLLRGRLDDVSVTDSSVSIGGLPPASATANFDNVHVTNLIGLHGVIGVVQVAASLGPAAVRDLLATRSCAGGLPDGIGATLTADPRVAIVPGHVSLLPPRGHSVQIRLVPSAVNGALVFHLIGLVEDGADASAATVNALGSQSDCTRTLPGLPFNLRLTSASANAGAVLLGLRGSGSQFQE